MPVGQQLLPVSRDIVESEHPDRQRRAVPIAAVGVLQRQPAERGHQGHGREGPARLATGLATSGSVNVKGNRDESVQPHPETSRTLIGMFELYS